MAKLSHGSSYAVPAAFAAFLVFWPVKALAIPSPLDHVHTTQTVHWKEPGSPALPWDKPTADTNDHNHLTSDNILNLPSWDINKAWDNRALRSRTLGHDDWAHGMILPGNAVRYGWGAGVPDDAKNDVEVVYNDWVAKATTQFNAKKDPWDRLAIDFKRENSGATEITIQWVENLQGTAGAYGDWSSATRQIRFEATPTIFFNTGNPNFHIRLGDAGPSGQSIDVSTPWSYNGTPLGTMTDFDYSDDGGTTFTDAPPGPPGYFPNLAWTHGTIAPADQLNISEMDFLTIARHEVGHSIALGHTGNGSAPIMRDDIAAVAHFGNTKGIDDASALAVAIDYTYAVPEPGTLLLLGSGLLGAAGYGWRRSRR